MVFTKTKEETLLSKKILLVEKNSSKSLIHSGNLKTIDYKSDGSVLRRGSIVIETKANLLQKIVIYDSGRARIQQI